MATERDPQPLTVHILPMRRRHLRSVMQIETQVYPRPWTTGLFLGELGLRSTRAYYVARVGRDVVGYAGLMLSVDEAHITTIAVDPSWQGHHIGRRLMLTVAREAIAREASALTLEVRTSNRVAQDLYRRFGFEPVGIRRGYYAETNEDAVIMWAREIDTPAYADLLDSLARGVVGETVIDPARRW